MMFENYLDELKKRASRIKHQKNVQLNSHTKILCSKSFIHSHLSYLETYGECNLAKPYHDRLVEYLNKFSKK